MQKHTGRKLLKMNPAVTVKENYEFRRIYRKGRSVVSPCLVVYCQKNRRGQSRLGVTVSTKLGHAVVRNRMRRRLREIVRLNEAKLRSGYDIVIVARRAALEADHAALTNAFLRAADKLELMEKQP